MSRQSSTEPKRFQYRHIFTDGRRCQSPCLRGPEGPENFCYYHHTTRRPVEDLKSRRTRQSTFALPTPEDRSAIQHAIGEVLQRIASNAIDPRRAGLLLYGLQIASLNLKKDRKTEDPEAHDETVDQITHDPALGALAPAAELYSDRPRSTLELLLELSEDDEKDAKPEPAALPTLQAVAETTATKKKERRRGTPKLPHLLRPRISRRHYRRNPAPRPEGHRTRRIGQDPLRSEGANRRDRPCFVVTGRMRVCGGLIPATRIRRLSPSASASSPAAPAPAGSS